jgi:hypothetical protein
VVAADRLFPNLASSTPPPGQFLATLKGSSPSALAGFYDDAFKSEDNAHSMIPTSYSNGGGSINLSNQFIRLNIGDYGMYFANNLKLGINFTSQSTTCMGHTLTEPYSLVQNERNAFFANIVRGGPSYYSFRDHRSERVIDSYKALPVVGFHSFGRSGSEVGGLFKMLVSGGYLPRTTKDLVKKHGLYPSTLLYLFKASLPYANADGTPVDFLNELRHRPGYLSYGTSTNSEFMPFNEWYHRYPEALHLHTMSQLATPMINPPPIALLKFIEEKRELNGVPEAGTVAVSGRTTVMTSLPANYRVSVTVDVGDSFDLKNRPLTFRWAALYPEQKNITIVHNGGTRYTITAQFNASLPKGRAVALMTASNGQFESNPVQVSFYPSTGAPGCSSYELGANPANEITVNQRPLFATVPAADFTVRSGETATIQLVCMDPEEKPIRYYRWLGEPGTLQGDQFRYTAAPSDVGKTISFRFICSDGTGGYNSLERKITVSP